MCVRCAGALSSSSSEARRRARAAEEKAEGREVEKARANEGGSVAEERRCTGMRLVAPTRRTLVQACDASKGLCEPADAWRRCRGAACESGGGVSSAGSTGTERRHRERSAPQRRLYTCDRKTHLCRHERVSSHSLSSPGRPSPANPDHGPHPAALLDPRRTSEPVVRIVLAPHGAPDRRHEVGVGRGGRAQERAEREDRRAEEAHLCGGA